MEVGLMKGFLSEQLNVYWSFLANDGQLTLDCILFLIHIHLIEMVHADDLSIH